MGFSLVVLVLGAVLRPLPYCAQQRRLHCEERTKCPTYPGLSGSSMALGLRGLSFFGVLWKADPESNFGSMEFFGKFRRTFLSDDITLFSY